MLTSCAGTYLAWNYTDPLQAAVTGVNGTSFFFGLLWVADFKLTKSIAEKSAMYLY